MNEPKSPINGEYVKCVCGIIVPHDIAKLDGDLNWHCPSCQVELELDNDSIFKTLMNWENRSLPQWWLMWFFVALIIFFLIVLINLIV